MRIYNTLTGQKEIFKPIKEGKVGIYVCGPTVYNYFHIGNARPFCVFDTLRRYMEYKGFDVNYVMNFTDIDDKMIRKAREEGLSVRELGDKYIKEFFSDAEGLGIKKASVHPRATECMDDIIKLVKQLIDKGYAYEIDGDVYYSTEKFADYGKLSGHHLEDLISGVRISEDERKHDVADFAIWKAQKPGEPAWDSPWGPGRPGWHIECSAMAMKFIGDTIDIHCGGKDLIFPHHENEIAQSEACTGIKFANYWMHNGFITKNKEKMAKSQNASTLREMVKDYDYEVMRFFILSAHYRSPLEFSYDLLEQAKSGIERIYNCIANLEFIKANASAACSSPEEKFCQDRFRKLFVEAMDDDLNTSRAIAVIFDAVRDINSKFTAEADVSAGEADECLDFIRELGGILGIVQKKSPDGGSLDSEIEELIEKRQRARKEKDFKLADEIRDKLKEQGIILEDTPRGVKWKRC